MEYTSNMGLNWQTLEMYPMVERISGIIDEIFLEDFSCKKRNPEARHSKIIEAEKLFRKDIEYNKELPKELITNIRKSLDDAVCYVNRKLCQE